MVKQMLFLYTHNHRRRRHRYQMYFSLRGLAGGADVSDVLTPTLPLYSLSPRHPLRKLRLLTPLRCKEVVPAALGDGDGDGGDRKAAVVFSKTIVMILLMKIFYTAL